MIAALLAGRKTQTRRILKPQPELMPGVSDRFHLSNAHGGIVNATEGEVREHGADFSRFAIGDRLYVRENHALVPSSAYRMSEGVQQTINPTDRDLAAIYAAGWDRSKPRWRPSIHMPRWASRLTLLVTDVRVERLQEISAKDALAEGIYEIREPEKDGWRHFAASAGEKLTRPTPEKAFAELWRSINGPESWDANPWVVAVTFKVIRANIDAPEDHPRSPLAEAPSRTRSAQSSLEKPDDRHHD
ncbi:hypothetical protein ABC766_00065 [Methylobacterium fujisawaense]